MTSIARRIITVSPGAVRTFVYQDPNGPVAQRAAATKTGLSDIAAEVAAQQNIATGRMAEPREIAAVIVFLLSEVAGNITGSDYVIDGGTIKTT